MYKTIIKQQKKDRRHKRIRSTLKGTGERPRLVVHKSNRHISAQLVNDDTHTTLAQVSSLGLADTKGKTMTEAGSLVGKALAEKAKAAGVTAVVFDRGGYMYTGIIRAVAEAAREGGLQF